MTTQSNLNTGGLIHAFNKMADAIEQQRDYLCELDGAIGDADHGITMSIGFAAIRKALAELDADSVDPTMVFNTAARSFLSEVGASAGPLYATAFMRAGASVKGLPQLNSQALGTAVQAMAEGIQTCGKAQAEDKTMLDAWLPAAQAAEAIKHQATIPELLSSVAVAADAGAEATRLMLAKKGRSAKLGERSLGHIDAGAASTAILLKAMADSVVEPLR